MHPVFTRRSTFNILYKGSSACEQTITLELIIIDGLILPNAILQVYIVTHILILMWSDLTKGALWLILLFCSKKNITQANFCCIFIPISYWPMLHLPSNSFVITFWMSIHCGEWKVQILNAFFLNIWFLWWYNLSSHNFGQEWHISLIQVSMCSPDNA